MDICILALEHGAEPLVAGDPTTAATTVATTRTLHPAAAAGALLADTWAPVWSSNPLSDLRTRTLTRKLPLVTMGEAHRN